MQVQILYVYSSHKCIVQEHKSHPMRHHFKQQKRQMRDAQDGIVALVTKELWTCGP